MTSLLFSGQGSQYVGMAKDLYLNNSIAVEFCNKANELMQLDFTSICFDGPLETLKETRYTQPALFLHEAILIRILSGKIAFQAVAGHSLGEYSALFAAGVLSFEDAFELVKLRGKLMFEAGTKRPGGMAAVIGLADEKVVEICASIESGVVVPANFNSPGQVVVSGDKEAISHSLQLFKNAGARMVTELPVSGAFHSPLMEPAQRELADAIDSKEFSMPTVPIYCNVNATPITSSSELKQFLIEQLVSPVKWTQTLSNMFENGITNFVEIGPGKVLQGLTKRTLTGVQISGFDTYNDFVSLG